MSKLIMTLLSGLALAGCGAESGDPSEAEGPIGDATEVSTTEEALVPSNCGTVTPPTSTTLSVGASGTQVATKNPPYGIPSCPNAELFRLQHFSARAGTTVAYAGRLPTNEADCRKIEVSQITYDDFGNQLGSRTRKFGGWAGGSCLFPIASNTVPMPPGQHREWVQALDQLGRPAAVRVTLFSLP